MPDKETYEPYVPRLLHAWPKAASHQALPGTMVFVDISGFTAMSERLARFGKLGAEEVVGVLNGTFSALITTAGDYGGDLLKFGGDALLLWFNGDDHVLRGAAAGAEMRNQLRVVGKRATAAGRVALKMTVGVHTGDFDFFVAGNSHRELIIAGPSATATVATEESAEAGQVLVSHAVAAALPARHVGPPRGEGRLLRGNPVADRPGRPSSPAPQHIGRHIPTGLRPSVGTGGGEGEHRPTTIAFVKYTHIDDLLAKHGAADLAERFERLIGLAQDACDEYEVTFLATDVDKDGGKIILTAGVPVASDADDERMLLTVRSIIEGQPPVDVKIGVNRGRIFSADVGATFRRTYTIIGDDVNLAARVMSQAETGQILATLPVLEASRTAFETSPVEPFLVKGKTEPVVAAIVGPATGAAETASQTVELPLFGHRDELKLLGKGADSAVAGTGVGFEITGAPGIGKSRLIDEIIATDERFRWLKVVCERYHRTTPYFAAGRLLRGLLDLPENGPEAAARRRLSHAVAEHASGQKPWLPLIGAALNLQLPATRQSRALDANFIKERTQDALGQLIATLISEPTGVVVNNAELMDESSAGVFSQLAGRTGSLPLLLAAIRRPEDTGWKSPHLEVIDVGPLEDHDALALVNALREDDPLIGHVADQVVQRADGNPMFLIELALATGGDGELPETVEATVSARIDQLAPDHRKLLRYAGAIGRAFNPELLASAIGDEIPQALDPAAWDALDAFLERERGSDRLRFRQKMYRHVAYAGLPFKSRRILHQRIGRELESRAGRRADAQAEILSIHFDEAADPSRAWHYSLVAGDEAAGKNANVEAVTFYTRALRWADKRSGLSRKSIRQVAESLGDSAEPAGLHDQADDAYARAFGLASARADQARLLRKRGLLRERAGRYPQALNWFTRGCHISSDARRADVLTERAELDIARSGVRFRQSRYAEAVAFAEAAVPLAERAGTQATLAHALYLLSVTKRYRSGHDDGEAARALKLYRAEKDLIGVSNVLNTQGIAAWRAGKWDTALKRYEGSSAARTQAGDLVRAAYITNNTALVLSDQGKWTQAEELFRQARNQFRAAGDRWMIGVSTSNLGRTLTRAGSFEEGERYLNEALELLMEIGADQFVLDAESRLIESLLFQGRSGLVLKRLTELAPRVEASQGTFELRSMLARLAGYANLQLGQPRKAAEVLEESLAVAREGNDRYQIGLTLEALERADGDARTERNEIFARMGIVQTPTIP